VQTMEIQYCILESVIITYMSIDTLKPIESGGYACMYQIRNS
jgi:hypothetical protein